MKTSSILMFLAAASIMRPGAAPAAEFTSNAHIDAGDVTYDGQEIVVRNCTLTVDGAHSFTRLLVVESGVITHSTAPSGQSDHRLNLSISEDVLVDATSRIGGPGLGLLSGPGAGVTLGYDGAGGGYGGVGCASGSAGAGGLPYGSITMPTDLGSGGGGASYYGMPTGAAGGGAILLTVDGTLTVNGIISANGGNSDYRVGAGSGGSIRVNAGTLTGSGSITANGGDATGSSGSAAGGGGRIAVFYGNNSFTGTISAFGGALGGETPASWGGAGTIFTKATSDAFGLLLIDNNDHFANASTRIKDADFNPVASFHLDVKRGARLHLETPLTVGNLHLFANSAIRPNPQQTDFHITAAGDFIIDPGGWVTADGMGHVAGPGAGATTVYDGGGGGYGGVGATSSAGGTGGIAYGSITAPTDPGSGGGGASWYGLSSGAPGGGSLRFTVAGTFTVNGTISANGGDSDYRAGAGSGGGIWASAGTLAGSGSITAEGGDATGSHGSAAGGGGRIALHSTTDDFSGTLSACGGGTGVPSPTKWGGAGTIYRKVAGSSPGITIIDNGSSTNSAPTRLAAGFWPAGVCFDLIISHGAAVYPQDPLTFGDVSVTGNSRISHDAARSGFHMVALGDFFLGGDSVITADGKGYGSLSGPGAGISGALAGGGGGYGGPGGAGLGGAGTTYGSSTAPVDLGSGGGGGAWYGNFGQAGGGALRLTVAGTLTIDGDMRANGLSSGGRDGAGSGGSIYLTTQSLAGDGAITANGGDGNSTWGGGAGGGGRIAIYSHSSPFTGTASANGGAQNPGSQGSILLSASVPFGVTGITPDGTIRGAIDHFDVMFTTPIGGGTFTCDDVVFTTPSGAVLPDAVHPLSSDGLGFRITVPSQTSAGSYSIAIGPDISNIFGQSMSEPAIGGVAIEEPVISGFVRDTSNAALSGVTVGIVGGSRSTSTDENGAFSLAVPAGFSGDVAASYAGWVFVPGVMPFANVTSDLTNRNFIAVAGTLAPKITLVTGSASGTCSWYGIRGVRYQPQSSTDLIRWLPFGAPVTGDNAGASFTFPITPGVRNFYRVTAEN